MSLTILFENEHVLVVDKSPGVLSIPGRPGATEAAPSLVEQLLSERRLRVWVVHRLDAEVSGLILFAKNAEDHRIANSWFEGRQVRKTYEAWTEGARPDLTRDASVEWRCKILRGKRRAYESPHGKDAVTRVTWLGESGKWQRWRVEPLTGRSHQIRFELFRHGFPVVGDELYGSKELFRPAAIALRAVSLDFSGCDQASRLGLPACISASSIAEYFEMAKA